MILNENMRNKLIKKLKIHILTENISKFPLKVQNFDKILKIYTYIPVKLQQNLELIQNSGLIL